MHEWGDSGISAILLAIIVILVLSLGVVRQARAKAVRYQRIHRLVTEEARRDEAAALAEYKSMVANCSFCIVCSSPSATRCSQCKAVRYCSSACQAQHWKQGHKQECRPATAVISPVSSSVRGRRNLSDAVKSSRNGSSESGGRTISAVKESHAKAERAKPAEGLSENGTLGRPKKILFPYDDFVELFHREGLQVPPRGLINCGNSCFANAVLQCLTFTRPLTAYLLEGTHGEQCKRSNDWCFMCELQDHVWRVRLNENPLSPFKILARIRNIGNHLGYGRQEDAHEFMRFAIDSMQSICVDEFGGEKCVDPRSQETTIIHHIFGGHLQSQVICLECLQESNRYESMMDLAVEIQGCVETLEDALMQFTTTECLDGDNKYKCDRCNAYVRARKRLTVHEAPNILTIALKRFQSGKFGKLNKRVSFPEVLDVSPYMSGEGDKPPLYRLYAVVVHVDMLNASFFGHYICYVKDSGGSWYKLDDSKVKEVELEKVMAQKAYMLLYARGFARPPPLTDGVNSSYPVEAANKLASDISVMQESSKVYPAPPYVREDETIAVRSQGLHAMVDFNHVLAEVQGSPRAVWDHSRSNGEIASPQPSAWELERIASSSTSLDDEASTEDSGYEATSSSFTNTSSYISSRASNPRIFVPPPEDSVCQQFDSFAADGMDYVSVDARVESQPTDVSEISLQPCAVEMACNAKIGKRRLEEGLSPLPIPKPLDTDQLPAWPSGNHGRSLASPQVHTSAISASHSMSEESPAVRQKYDLEDTGESMPSASVSRQRMMSTDLPSAGDGAGQEADDSDKVLVETADSGEETSVMRAKRQHVEIESVANAHAEGHRLEEPSYPMEESSPELGQRDMDWDICSQHSGSPPSLALVGSGRPSGEVLSADSGELSSPRKDISGPHVPDLLEWDSKGSLSSGEAIEGEVQEEGLTCQERGKSIQRAAPSNVMLRDHACNGPEMERSVPQNLEASAATADMPMSLQGLASSSNEVQDRVPKIVDCHAGPQEPDKASSSVDGEIKRDFVRGKVDTNSSENVNLAPDSPAITGLSKISGPRPNGESQGVPNKSVRGNARKSKSKPLFAPGFLNRPQTSAKAKAKGSRVASTPLVSVEDKNLNQVETSGKMINEPGSPTSFVKERRHVSQKDKQNGELLTSPTAMNQCSYVGGSLSNDGQVCDPCSPCDAHQTPKAMQPKPSDESAGGSSKGSLNCDGRRSTHANHSGHLPPSDNGLNNQISKVSVKSGEERPSGKSAGATGQSSTGNGKEPAPQLAPQVNTNEERRAVELASDPAVPSLTGPPSGKQKQGRNETCNCGSQRKWKKCCGKAVVIKPEQGRRRLVV